MGKRRAGNLATSASQSSRQSDEHGRVHRQRTPLELVADSRQCSLSPSIQRAFGSRKSTGQEEADWQSDAPVSDDREAKPGLGNELFKLGSAAEQPLI